MPKGVCWAFDVDETLEISNGPVKLDDLMALRVQGHIVGICGNWGLFCQKVSGWQHLASFVNCSPVIQMSDGSIVGDKAWWLRTFMQYCPADEYVMVGNVFGRVNSLGHTCGSRDSEAAEQAGWRFIVEDDFAKGVR